MIAILRLSSLLPLLLLAACVSAGSPAPPRSGAGAPPAAPPTLRIGVIGDQTGTADLDAAYRDLARGVELLREAHRADPLHLVLHVGDLVESREEPAAIRRRFERAAGILDRLPVPWYLAAGDHDVNPPAYRRNPSDRSREILFAELYGPRIPGFAGELHYGFDVSVGAARYHVVSLFSNDRLHADPRWGDVFLAEIGDAQLAWLERDLEASADAAGVVVFLHHPLSYHWSGWQRVHELLRRFPVALVLSGHLHYPQDGGTLDGIRYLGVGATGGTTKTGSRQAGDVRHVSVVEVRGREVVDIELVPFDGEPLALAPRREMDRVQALDVMLGKLWDLAERNPVHLLDGQLVDDCESGAPARLAVASIGNPIDRPVAISITPEPPVVFTGPEFAPGFCARLTGPGSCELAVPTPNVVFSNDSGVELTPDPPLWETGLELAGAGAAPAEIGLTLEVSYPPDSPVPQLGPLRLEREVALAVPVCP